MQRRRVAKFVVLALALTGWSAADANARCGPVRDDFNRANSTTPGPLWSEKSGGDVKVEQNKLTSSETPLPLFPSAAGPSVVYAGTTLPYQESACVDIFGGTEPGAYVRVGFSPDANHPFVGRAYASIADSSAPFDGNFDKIFLNGNASGGIVDVPDSITIPSSATGRFQVGYHLMTNGDWSFSAGIDTNFDGDVDRSLGTVFRGGSFYGTLTLGVAGGATIDNFASPSAQPEVWPANTGHYVEGGSAAAIDPGITVLDDDDASLEGATVTGFGDGAFSFADTAKIKRVAASSGSTVLKLAGTATVGEYQAALRSVKFSTPSKNPGTKRVFQFTVDDGDTASDGALTTLSVTPINDAPAVSVAATPVTYPEKAAPLVVDPALSVTDIDSPNLVGATARIASGSEAGDKLSWQNQPGITASYAGGVLTLSGSASIFSYEDALRSVAFSSTNNAPKLSKVIQFAVNDGALASNVASRTVSTTSIDDAPVVKVSSSAVLSSSGRPLQVVRAGDPASVIDAGLSVADADDTAAERAVVSLSDALPGELLAFTPTHNITGSYASGQLTLTGTASLAEYQDALRSVTFTPDATIAPTANHVVSFVVGDGDKDGAPALREILVQANPQTPGQPQTEPLVPGAVIPAGPGSASAPAAATPATLRLDQLKLRSKRLSRRGKGDQVSFRLNAGAKVTLRFTRGKSKLSFTKSFSAAGTYKVGFKAKIGKKALTRGAWKLTLTATAAGQKASSAKVTVSVV